MSARWVSVFQGSIPEVITLRSACEASGIPTHVPDLNLVQVDPFLRGGNALALELLVPEDRAEAARALSVERPDAASREFDRTSTALERLGRRVRWCIALGITWPVGIRLGWRYLRWTRALEQKPPEHAWTVGSFWACVVLTLAALLVWSVNAGLLGAWPSGPQR